MEVDEVNDIDDENQADCVSFLANLSDDDLKMILEHVDLWAQKNMRVSAKWLYIKLTDLIPSFRNWKIKFTEKNHQNLLSEVEKAMARHENQTRKFKMDISIESYRMSTWPAELLKTYMGLIYRLRLTVHSQNKYLAGSDLCLPNLEHLELSNQSKVFDKEVHSLVDNVIARHKNSVKSLSLERMCKYKTRITNTTHGDGEDTTHGDGEDTTHGDGEDTTHGDGEDTTHGDGEDKPLALEKLRLMNCDSDAFNSIVALSKETLTTLDIVIYNDQLSVDHDLPHLKTLLTWRCTGDHLFRFLHKHSSQIQTLRLYDQVPEQYQQIIKLPQLRFLWIWPRCWTSFLPVLNRSLEFLVVHDDRTQKSSQQNDLIGLQLANLRDLYAIGPCCKFGLKMIQQNSETLEFILVNSKSLSELLTDPYSFPRLDTIILTSELDPLELQTFRSKIPSTERIIRDRDQAERAVRGRARTAQYPYTNISQDIIDTFAFYF